MFPIKLAMLWVRNIQTFKIINNIRVGLNLQLHQLWDEILREKCSNDRSREKSIRVRPKNLSCCQKHENSLREILIVSLREMIESICQQCRILLLAQKHPSPLNTCVKDMSLCTYFTIVLLLHLHPEL